MTIPRSIIRTSSTGSGRPLVSVIIPTYNRAWTLAKAVRSIFDQTYRPIECLVIDDGSTDSTAEIVRDLSDECPHGIDLKCFTKDNGGPNSARNRGLLECTGEFICYLDSDDWLLPRSVEERARVLQECPDVDFCYGLCSVRDENGLETRAMNEPWPKPGEARVSRYLFDTNSPLIRRSTCANVGLWREDDLQGHEYEYFSRLKYHSKKVSFINEALSVYIRHNNGCINDGSLSFWLQVFKNALTVRSLIASGRSDNPEERRQLASLFRNVAKKLYSLNEYSSARAALEESFALQRGIKVLIAWGLVTLVAIVKNGSASRKGE